MISRHKDQIKNNGFSLIEIIIVISIISILATIAIPRFSTFVEYAKIANDKQLAAIIANAGAAFVASHRDEPDFINEDVTIPNLFNKGLIKKQYSSDDLRSFTYTDIDLNYDGMYVRCVLDGDIDYIVVK